MIPPSDEQKWARVWPEIADVELEDRMPMDGVPSVAAGRKWERALGWAKWIPWKVLPAPADIVYDRPGTSHAELRCQSSLAHSKRATERRNHCVLRVALQNGFRSTRVIEGETAPDFVAESPIAGRLVVGSDSAAVRSGRKSVPGEQRGQAGVVRS
jgi:hypothetical protein